ncbi:MAG TPA: hypothetical protein PK027_12690, partial [Aquimonas sp.]|nr:hypothetical protein [Aquimonas sp.]
MQKGESSGHALRDFLNSYPGRVLIAADSAGRREALIEQLAAHDLRPGASNDWRSFVEDDGARYQITIAALEEGFALREPALCILTERQFYPERAAQTRRRKRAGREPDAIIRDLSE